MIGQRLPSWRGDYLEQAGFRVHTADRGRSAPECVRREKPDLIVLDLRLPDIDGLQVCRDLRRESSVPIIMLTARVEEADRIIGMEMGADDYVTKPFSPRELVARVRALFRRVDATARGQSKIVRAGDVEIDLAGHRATLKSEPLRLTPVEFSLLAALAGNPGQTRRAQLMYRAYEDEYETVDTSIDSHIKNLRRKIEEYPSEPVRILTVYGFGYKFAEGA